MEDKHIRILLDTSLLKDKPHKRVWMLILTYDLKSIAEFKEAVIKKLGLDRNDIEMSVNGGLLLEEESILVLRENDIVLVQYGNQSSSFNHFSNSEIFYNSRISDIRLNSDENDDRTQKSLKKKKRKSEVVPIVIPDSNDENSNKRKRDLNASDELENDNSKILLEKENSANLCDVNDETVYKAKKKKRKKSHSSSTPKDFSMENVQSNENLFEEKEASTFWDVKEISKSQKDLHLIPSPVPSTENDLIQVEKVSNIKFSKVVPDCKENGKSKPHSPSNKVLKQNDTEIPDSANASITDVGPEISTDNQSDVAKETFVQSNNCKKKKRRRHRKRKVVEQNLVSPFMTENVNNSSSLKKDNPAISTPCDNFAGLRKHIRFDSPIRDCTKSDPNYNKNSTGNILLKVDTKEKCISENAGKVENSTKPGVYADCPKTYEPSPQKTEINSIVVSPLKNGKQNGVSMHNMVSQSKVYETKRSYTKLPYEECPTLNALPCIGTCIAFKLLELNEYYSPEVSAFKEGILKSINPKTGEMEIELTQMEVKPGRVGKFENLKEDEIPPEEVLQKVTASWSTLIDPRLVSRC